MNLIAEIANWDRKSSSSIQQTYDRFGDSPSFGSDLVALLDAEELQVGATWLLKRHLEHGGTLEPQQVNALCRSLAGLASWEARLHVLQTTGWWRVPKRYRKQMEAFVRASLGSSNKFERAWAYHGFYYLALAFPEYRTEAETRMEAALQEEPASVKARVRKLVKLGF